jgi:ribosome maturation factor RimP
MLDRDQPAEDEKAQIMIPFSALAEARLILTDELIRDALKADKDARKAANQNDEDEEEA